MSGSDNWQVVASSSGECAGTDLSGQSQIRRTVILIVGVDLGDINGTISRLAADRPDRRASSSSLALAIVGVAIVRASLRPLTDIERTAQAIAAGDLSRRVPDQDPVTEVGRLGRSLNTMLSPDRVVVLRPGPVRGGRAAF